MPTHHPTAPLWYRPTLAGRNLFLKTLSGLRPPSPEVEWPAEMNVQPSPLTGRPIAERILPGSANPRVLAEHLSRYLWALPRLGGGRVVDLGCGTGYGSFLLSWAATDVVALDLSESAIAHARDHYPGVDYRVADITSLDEMPDGDVAVCFEVLEHLPNAQAVIDTALAAFPRALFSFPNPWWGNSRVNPHHVQDWPLRECRRRLRAAGARDIRVFSQSHRNSNVVRGARPRAYIWIFECSTA